MEDNPGGVSQFVFNQRFPGQQFDIETGLHYNNARYYDPTTGRFITSDPIGLGGGLNTFGYGEADPLAQSDPTGNWVVVTGAIGAGIGALIGGGLAAANGGDVKAGLIKGAIAGGVAGLTAGIGGPMLGSFMSSGLASGVLTGALSGGASNMAVQSYERYTGERCAYSTSEALKAAAVGAVLGGVFFRPQTPSVQHVVSYASKGVVPDLEAGMNRWVMAGADSWRNYLATGGPAGSLVPKSNSIQASMFASSLKNPAGPAGNINFLMGQRLIK